MANTTTASDKSPAGNGSAGGSTNGASPVPVISFAHLGTAMDMPNLLDVQLKAFDALLERDVGDEVARDFGLERVFNEIFPSADSKQNFMLEFVSYALGEPKYTVEECMERDMTYGAPLKATLRLVINEDVGGEKRPRDILEKEVYLGELPLLTEQGTFVINGAERVIVSQLHRSPGVVFEETIHPNGTKLFSARIIPFRGSWVEFSIDIHDVIHVHIDKKKKFPATALLRAFGHGTDADVLDLFYGVRELRMVDIAADRAIRREAAGTLLAASVPNPSYEGKPESIVLIGFNLDEDEGWVAEDQRRADTGQLLVGQGEAITADVINRLLAAGIEEVAIYRESEAFLAHRAGELTPELIRQLRRANVEKVWVYSSPIWIPLRGRYEDLSNRRDWSHDPRLAADVVDPDTGEVLAEAGVQFDAEMFEGLAKKGVRYVLVFTGGARGESPLIKNTLAKDPTRGEPDALYAIYSLLRPGEAPNLETARTAIERLFFSPKRYDLGRVGRYKVNQRLRDTFRLLNVEPPASEVTILTVADFIAIIRYLIELHEGRGFVDDIDHLGNRRVRSVGELIANQFSVGLSRMARLVRERMSIASDPEQINIDDLVNARTVSAVIQSFFGSSQLSQFLDQTNPLAELTHKRRLSALGPGGLTRERAGFEVRDVHYSHYGRMCPIETPEGPNIGLITSLSTFAQINNLGFIETPYRKVEKGKVTEKIVWLTANEEEEFAVAQANAELNPDGTFVNPVALCRQSDDYPLLPPEHIDYMDVSPDQLVAVSPALIPFLEHDDANRALMGSNMQRQAVPLLFPRRPLVGTGLEGKVARDTGAVVVARRGGMVTQVRADEIVIDTGVVKPGGDEPLAKLSQFDRYKLKKFWRTNQDTAINQRPLVTTGQMVEPGDIIADGASTDRGELALGRNLTVAFMPWYGHNFEDAIVISERLVKDDEFTSIHIQELELHVRDTKRGMEEITREIPNVSEEALKDLDERGIVRVGAAMKPGDILVGKITPKGETELSPEEKLLTAIFGEKAKDVKDSSLRVPPGMAGTVIDVKIFSRRIDDALLEKEHGEKIGLLREQERDEIARVTEVRDEELRELLRDQAVQLFLKRGTIEPFFKEGKKLTADLVDELDFSKLDLTALKIKNPAANEKVQRVIEESRQRIERIREKTEESIDKVLQPDELSPGVVQLVKVYIAERRKIAVGDKVAGRHGNKGVIARIVPEEDMPYLPDGTSIDIVLNPLGVPSRMNVGQILETHLGWCGRILGFEAKTPVFHGATEDEIGVLLKLAGVRWAHDCHNIKSAEPPELTDQHVFELIRALRRSGVQRGQQHGNGTRPSGSPLGLGRALDAVAADSDSKLVTDYLSAVEDYLVAAASELASRQGEASLAKAGFEAAAKLSRRRVSREGLDEAVEQFMRGAGLTPAGKTRLRDGRTGEYFTMEVTVGNIYMMKLAHLVDDKIHARSIGPYSLVTQQPLAGKAQFGGQRFGEMEVWALEAYGAAHTLQEVLTVKSDDVSGRSRAYEAIVKGENLPDPGIPESFNVLVKELQSLGLSVELGQSDDGV
ncbi:MAG: DNA-directed RNA polymerase subunit beta [Gemmatimonadota bacterium]|nr:MAG: DNA-directed RNA polymerase subunit beta [Gemmatimonadota bacterium]